MVVITWDSVGAVMDTCQNLKLGSKRTYLCGAPPNTPPYTLWGALTSSGTSGDSWWCQRFQCPPSGSNPWFILLLTQRGTFWWCAKIYLFCDPQNADTDAVTIGYCIEIWVIYKTFKHNQGSLKIKLNSKGRGAPGKLNSRGRGARNVCPPTLPLLFKWNGLYWWSKCPRVFHKWFHIWEK